jgi:hypothetical protein
VVSGVLRFSRASEDGASSAHAGSDDGASSSRANSGYDVPRRWLFVWFLFCVIPMFLMSQSAFVMLKFVLDYFLAVARLVIFFLGVCVIVKRGPNGVLVLFLYCLGSCF